MNTGALFMETAGTKTISRAADLMIVLWTLHGKENEMPFVKIVHECILPNPYIPGYGTGTIWKCRKCKKQWVLKIFGGSMKVWIDETKAKAD